MDIIGKEAKILLKHKVACYNRNEELIYVINLVIYQKMDGDINLDNDDFLELHGIGFDAKAHWGEL